MTWPVLAFLLTAVFALGFHLGQKLAPAKATNEPDASAKDALRREAPLTFSYDVLRRSL